MRLPAETADLDNVKVSFECTFVNKLGMHLGRHTLIFAALHASGQLHCRCLIRLSASLCSKANLQ